MTPDGAWASSVRRTGWGFDARAALFVTQVHAFCIPPCLQWRWSQRWSPTHSAASRARSQMGQQPTGQEPTGQLAGPRRQTIGVRAPAHLRLTACSRFCDLMALTECLLPDKHCCPLAQFWTCNFALVQAVARAKHCCSSGSSKQRNGSRGRRARREFTSKWEIQGGYVDSSHATRGAGARPTGSAATQLGTCAVQTRTSIGLQ